jgi:hypothetical protein
MDSIQGGNITPQQLHDQRSHFIANISDAVSRCSIRIGKVHDIDDTRAISGCTWRGTVTQQIVRTRRQPGSPRQYLYSDYDPSTEAGVEPDKKTYMTRNGEYPCFRY